MAAEDTARASSRAVNSPLWRRTNGHSVRRLPRRRSGGSKRGVVLVSHLVVFYADTVTGGVAQADFQCVDLIGRQFDPQAHTVGIELFIALFRAEGGQGGVQGAEVLKASQQLQPGQRHQRQARGGAQALGGGATVGAYQATGAEFDAAEPARHHHHHPVEALPVDCRRDRTSSRAGRLAIVAGTIVPPCR